MASSRALAIAYAYPHSMQRLPARAKTAPARSTVNALEAFAPDAGATAPRRGATPPHWGAPGTPTSIDSHRAAVPDVSLSALPATAEHDGTLTLGLGAAVAGVAGVSHRRRPLHDAATRVTVVPLARPARARLAAKRVIDVVGAVVGLLLSVPVLLVLALAIRIDSPGRVLFAQARVARGGRLFRCYKLRTMCTNAEERLQADRALRESYVANGYKLPVDCDPRVTRFGRLLRATSLDELPQLWNVLKGDMSLVGPRPVVEEELAHYGAARDLLLTVRPGITGAWAVRGRSRIGYPERAAIELDYVQSWTTRGDLAILLRTFGVVLQRRGAY